MPIWRRTCDRVDAGGVDVLAVEQDLALDACAPAIELVHAVERAQERRLAAARGADQRRDLVRLRS